MKKYVTEVKAEIGNHAAETGRRIHIEFLRIAGAFLVIVNHTNSSIFLVRAPSITWFTPGVRI